MKKLAMLLILSLVSLTALAIPPVFFHGVIGSAGCFQAVCRDTLSYTAYTSNNCNLSSKSSLNFGYLNNYFTFMGQAAATNLVSTSKCSPMGDYNTTFSNFNVKTNQNNPISTISGQPSAGTINLNFNNLTSNIKIKLESTYSFYNPYSEPIIGNTVAGTTLYTKVENSSYSKVVVTPVNTTSCVNNGYCRSPFSSEVSSGYQLATLALTSGGTTVNKSMYLNRIYSEEYAPYRAVDLGCHNAPYVSTAGYNIWACEGGGGYRCSTFCYLGNCSGDLVGLFNTYYSGGQFTFLGWEYTTGDIRGGCSGAFVYGIRVRYSVNKYQVKVQ